MPTTDELTYVSFPISKFDKTDDGDLIVYGKATDGSVDSDQQIVDPTWSAKALQTWLETGGNVRVQHQAARDPAGKGLQVETTPDGHYVKALVVEPVAKRLVEKGVLTAYSVGIASPVIERDPTGKARNGIITSGTLAELSLVDRPANKNCGLVVAKAAKDGSPEFVGEMFGDEGFISKAVGDDTLTKVAGADAPTGSAFSPADMAKLAAKKAELAAAEQDAALKAEEERDVVDKVVGDGRFADAVVDRLAAALKADSQKRQMDASVGGGVDRDQIPAEDFAGRDRSFPIVKPGDVSDAATSIGRAGPDNYPADQLKQRIISIARRKGPDFEAALPDSWKVTQPEAVKGAKDCLGCGRTYHADAKVRNCESCGKDLPNATKGLKAAKPTCTKCGTKAKKGAAFCSSCGTKLSPALPDDDDGDSVDKGATPGDGVKDKDTKPVPSHREPDGPQTEIFEQDAGLGDGDEDSEGTAEPAPTWGKSVDYATARLHDALCAAYHPEVVADTYPALKGIAAAVDAKTWQDEAMALVASGDLEAGQRALQVATAAKTISMAHPEAVADARAALHKGFTDMYPGVGGRITPQTMVPGRFTRPYISPGHASLSIQAPASQPPTPTARQVDAADFGRDYMTAGRADLSPGAKGDNSPARGGSAAYAAGQVALTQNAMKELHDHIAGRHERLCPMTPADTRTPVTFGGADTGVINPVATKSAEPAAEQVAGTPDFVTAEAVQKMLTTHLAERDETIADLRRQIDELAAQPDPNRAPMRGIVATKTTSGGAGTVDRRSLVDEAIQQEHAEKLAYMLTLTKSGDPILADQARSEYERLLTLTPSGTDRT